VFDIARATTATATKSAIQAMTVAEDRCRRISNIVAGLPAEDKPRRTSTIARWFQGTLELQNKFDKQIRAQITTARGG
jgi:hypothetical protein